MENYEKGILKDVIKQLEIIADRIENVHDGTEQELNEAEDYIQDAINAVANVL